MTSLSVGIGSGRPRTASTNPRSPVTTYKSKAPKRSTGTLGKLLVAAKAQEAEILRQLKAVPYDDVYDGLVAPLDRMQRYIGQLNVQIAARGEP